MHKKGIRHVCNSKYNAHTEPLFKKNRILQINDLFKLQCAKIMYKKMQRKLHGYHASKLTTNYERNNTNTRQRYDVNVHMHKNKLSEINTINYKVGTSWNELSLDTKMLAFKTLPTFTKRVKNLYLTKYTDICTKRNCYVCK